MLLHPSFFEIGLRPPFCDFAPQPYRYDPRTNAQLKVGIFADNN